jgi:hypothetical protein
MTNALSPVEQAAIPTAIQALEAVQAFVTNMGPDPLQWVAKYPGSTLVLLGTLQNLVPSLLVSEGGAVQTLVNNQTTSWINTLKAAQTPPPA